MKKKTELIIAVTLVTALTCFLYTKYYRKKKTDFPSLKKAADKYFLNKDYNNAIFLYTKCLFMINDHEVIHRLGLCYYKLFKYEEALDQLKIKTNNLDILKLRTECYNKLGMKKEYLMDYALYESLIKDEKMQEKIMQNIKEICENEAHVYINEEGIDVNKEEVIKGLVSIENIDKYYDQIENQNKTEINNTEEQDSNEIVFEDKEPDDEKEVKNLLKSIILFHKGKKEEALSLLESSTYKYAILVRAYFLTLLNQEVSFTLPLDDKLTTLYLHSKIYKDKSDTFLTKALQNATDLPISKKDFLYVDLLIFYISKKDTTKILDLIDEVSSSLTSPLVDLIGEYYLKTGDHSKLMSLLPSHSDTPGKLLLMGLYYLSINNKKEAINILYSCISQYSSYFKAYLYLGNILINDDLEESRRLFNKGVRYSSNYDEVYIIKQSLLLIEVHEYIKEQHTLANNKNEH
ncbi:mitochondrial import receptor subunit (Tom70) [Vairimorpha necatrix]|uniref:Mitochondrial import receptor subunit (Tom70) n=1 Tax=Vairimorpha necatrix TaxID=6039 RepID=A0AAX4JA92_9MICR